MRWINISGDPLHGSLLSVSRIHIAATSAAHWYLETRFPGEHSPLEKAGVNEHFTSLSLPLKITAWQCLLFILENSCSLFFGQFFSCLQQEGVTLSWSEMEARV